VRQEWSPEELLANWTLVDGDWELVANKSGATRLGFGLLLKFFELEGRFPDVLEEVPPAAVDYVADLVKVPAADFAKYTLVGRTAEYHRKQIREALGFRPSTVERDIRTRCSSTQQKIPHTRRATIAGYSKSTASASAS
jgi:Transposase.